MSIEQDKINQLDSDHRALLVEKNRLQSELEQARNERNVAQSELAVCCEDRDARALERDQVQQSLNRVEAGLRQQHELAQRLESERDELTEYVKRDDGRILQLEACCAEMRHTLEELACLGNGDTWGNSIGNTIAQKALKIDNCGQGWVSPEAHAVLLDAARHALRLARDCHGGSVEWNSLAERIG